MENSKVLCNLDLRRMYLNLTSGTEIIFYLIVILLTNCLCWWYALLFGQIIGRWRLITIICWIYNFGQVLDFKKSVTTKVKQGEFEQCLKARIAFVDFRQRKIFILIYNPSLSKRLYLLIRKKLSPVVVYVKTVWALKSHVFALFGIILNLLFSP